MTDYEKALCQAQLMLEQGGGHLRERIAEIARAAIQTVTLISPPGHSVSIDETKLIRELEARITWTIGREFVMEDDADHIQWLPDKRSEIKWRFWDRYRQYLLKKTNPLPLKIVDSIDELTDNILGKLEDPHRDGPWDRRGLIVGHVQSGKTGNYIGLICKAADAGYKIIVVLAGVNDNLRAQTQLRIDEGFLGYSAAQATTFYQGNQAVGVGKLQMGYRAPVHALTGYNRDFSRPVAQALNINPFGNDPIILVVKKNKTILSNLITWLAGYATNDAKEPQRKCPLPKIRLLVIDDEADHASINTRLVPIDPVIGNLQGDYNVTAINEKIRQLLSLFSKKAYIGYTATPFANIFIHPEDYSAAGTIGRAPNEIRIPIGEGLFPRSFIISLPIPSNYIGPLDIFGTDPDPETGVEGKEPLPLIYNVMDNESYIPRNHRIDFVPAELPPSLKLAIRCFILTCAARIHRGADKEHNSMLVHITRFVNVQRFFRELVNQELRDIVNRIKYGDGASSAQIMKELQELWESEFEPITKAVVSRINDPLIITSTWKDISPQLGKAAQKIVVKQISGQSMDVLDYQNSPNGVSVIAVGGNKLSRGLTLEGLSISYFLRPSKMYDTLMQMGRWFGYRQGYLDLCRLYTTGEMIDWYRHISIAAEELRWEFEIMADAQKTPSDYGLRVRSHPNGLLITSLVKKREAKKLKVSYDGRRLETTIFQIDERIARRNLEATNGLLEKLPTLTSAPYEWSDVPAKEVIAFLRGYVTHPNAPEVHSIILADYISRKTTTGCLIKWTVALLSSKEDGSRSTQKLIYPVNLFLRTNKKKEPQKYTIQSLLSPKDEKIGLSHKSIEDAFAETIEIWKSKPVNERSANKPSYPSGPSLRQQRSPQEGLLILYSLNSDLAELPYKDIPTIAIGISFPGDKFNPDDGVEYDANVVYIRELGDEEGDTD